MGRTAMLLVLGLGVALGLIGFQINQSAAIATNTQYAYLKYMYARNLARTSVHAALRTFDRGQTPAVGVDTKFNNGTFRLDSLRSSANGDTLRMVTRGEYAESTYVMKLTLFRTTKPFPTVNAAIAIRATPVTFSLSGHASVDGHNYNMAGTNKVGFDDKPGVATMTKADSATVVNEAGPLVDGLPPVVMDPTTVDPLTFLDIYKSNADYLYDTPGTFAAQTWGDAANPVIVYCNAGDDTSFAIKFTGGVTGYGILVVRGNVQFNGNLDFRGLVVVDGFNTTVSFGAAGTPGILGGVIIAGNAGASVTLKGTGTNAKVAYSSEALRNARNIGKLRYYTILDWFE